MKVWALWHGGSSYAVPSIPDDLEEFTSIGAARETFWSRADWDPQYPCVENSSMVLYFHNPTEDQDPYPDREVTMGPRGGVQVGPT